MAKRESTAGDVVPGGERTAWRWIWPLALLLASLASFWPCVYQGFVALDDDANFELNHRFRGLDAERVEWMFTGFHYGHWHPLTWLTFGLDYELHGLDGAAYHRTNLAIHAASVLSFYLLAAELLAWTLGWRSATSPASGLSRAQSFALHACAALATATWGLHPLRVESVAWATERRDLLSALFLILAVWAYVRGARAAAWRPGWLALALGVYALSLLSKAWGMTLPVVLLALDVFPLRRLRSAARPGLSFGRLCLEKLWFAPLAAASGAMAAAAQREIAAAVSLDEHGVLERVAQAAYGLCFYVLKTLWPANLSCHHLLEIDFQWNRPLHLAAIASVVLVTAVAVVRASRWPALLATWFLYGVLVSPVLGLFQSGAQKVADRYAHLAAMPFSLLLAGAALVYATRAGDDVVLGRRARVVAVLTAGLALVLGVLSNVQTRVWKDSETLFRRAAEVEPVNYFVLHNLAVALYRRQAYAEALEVERRSVEAHPNKGNEEARYTLALLHSLLGRADEAEAEWRRTLEIEPTHQNSFNALKPRMLNRGGAAEWTQFLEQLVAKRPDALTATLELEQHYAASQRFDAIVDLWQRALASDKVPRTQAELGLARGYVGSRRFAEAEPLALRAAPADRGAKFVLDALAAAQGSHAAALEFWERARRARVPAAMVENGIGKAHLAAGRLAEAEAALLRAQALDPRDKDYVIDVCELFVRQNRLDDARTNVRAVLAVDPAFPRALELERRLGARRP